MNYYYYNLIDFEQTCNASTHINISQSQLITILFKLDDKLIMLLTKTIMLLLCIIYYIFKIFYIFH